MLDHPEHVRSERVSKWFKRVGRNLSWHNVTVLVDDGINRRDFGPYQRLSLQLVSYHRKEKIIGLSLRACEIRIAFNRGNRIN
jgi:hypothetical protein